MNIFKKVYIISSKELLFSYFLFILISVFNTFFEIVSLLYIFPLLDFLVLNKQSPITIYFFDIINKFDFFSKYAQINLVLFFFVIIFLLKFSFNFLSIFYTQILQKKLRKDFSVKLLNGYLDRKYSFFVNTNSSFLIRNIFQEVPRVILGVISNLFNLISEFLLIISILIVLFVYDLKSTFIAFLIISFFGILFIILSRKLIKNLAEKRLKFDGKFLKNIKEIFDNIKTIKINERENFFLNLTKKNAYKSFNSHFFYNLVAQSPRIIFEFVLIFIVLIVLIVNISNQNIIYTLAIYSVASLRLIPSISKVINSISNIRFDMPSLDILYRSLKDIKKAKLFKYDNSIVEFKNSFTLKKISFSYLKKVKILRNINMKFKKNHITGIIGASGSGKSTLVDIISGLIQPNSGKILLDNKQIVNENNLHNWKKIIGYMPQNSTLLDMSIKDNITLGDYKNNKKDFNRLNKAIKDSELFKFIKKLDNGINTRVGDKGAKISGGEIQRIALARTLYSQSKIIILDEATSSLDNHTERKILDTLKKLKNKTVIFITHKTNNLKFCSKVYKLTSVNNNE